MRFAPACGLGRHDDAVSRIRGAIAAMGGVIGPDVMRAVHALYHDEQARLAADQPVTAADLAYGSDPRHRLDLYAPASPDGPAPIVIWVHGGGFRRGEKSSVGHPYEAHAGRWAARAGYVGLVANYRLAPGHGWPAGGEDVGLVVDWARANGAAYGGDPERIFLVGTSAGAAHVATHFMLRPDAPGIAGAVLLSGLYGVMPYDDERDLSYYGADDSLHAARAPLDAVAATATPLLVACAEFDPPRFHAEFAGLLQHRLDRRGRLPLGLIVSGHNHLSLAYHLGTADARLADEIAIFINDPEPSL